MNTDQVVEMIDAITEGKYYAHGFKTNRDTITIEVGTNAEDERNAPNEFWFSSFTPGANFLAKIDDPRTAREIAGALIAWANRKDGKETKLATDAIIAAWGMPQDDNQINNSRQNWYAQNIKLMSVDTLRRNFDDLTRITKTKGLNDSDKADANRSRDFIWAALRERAPETKQCDSCLLLDGPFHYKFCEGRRAY